MIKEIINCFKLAAEETNSVGVFKYEDELLLNCLPNNANYLVQIETDSYMTFKSEVGSIILNMNVLSFVDTTELEVQDKASRIGLAILKKVQYNFRNIISLDNYSIYYFTKKSDDESAGCRFTIELNIPEFYDWCDEEYTR